MLEEPMIFDDWSVGLSGQIMHLNCSTNYISQATIWFPSDKEYRCVNCNKTVPKDIEVAADLIFTATWQRNGFVESLKKYIDVYGPIYNIAKETYARLPTNDKDNN